jgi:hypothetical protein
MSDSSRAQHIEHRLQSQALYCASVRMLRVVVRRVSRRVGMVYQ